ncbi:3-oxoacyl-ACP synthase III family protein [Streptomyces endophytica]|uniref:Ketoacyl-ACP synthase III n=1 Tax=Streptomyces endophytica TaxID=2991496 RepID=A0ABY6PF07_9ACTN|nr:3-oxoacyl-[acyl-carrier-protein] synthase III C-terminal domain-containing protein [Streptomyces endophytica]UZJ32118.1 ketoacyl-ACP synthase III [Streptomyces endophytica]
MPQIHARLAGVAVHLPETLRTTTDTEQRVAAAGTGFRPPPGLVHRLTGVERLHVMPDDWQASDLAAAAARKLLADTGTDAGTIDLLLFAAASQDMIEPATSHMVADRLGLRCPVFDVKNACNSVLNALETAHALIAQGSYRRILIACGESPSRAVRWAVPDLRSYLAAIPGYTLSDAGAALLVEASAEPGILGCGFTADSASWNVGTLASGGSAHPRGDEHTYFRLDGVGLRRAFERLGPQILDDTLDRLGVRWQDMAAICVHQVSKPYLDQLAERFGLPPDKIPLTVTEHGNAASASLPLQLVRARESGRAGVGDLVALIGLAGGISMGVSVIRL